MSDLYTGPIQKNSHKEEQKKVQENLQRSKSFDEGLLNRQVIHMEQSNKKAGNGRSIDDQINALMPKQINGQMELKKAEDKLVGVPSDKKIQALPENKAVILPAEIMLDEKITSKKETLDNVTAECQQLRTNIEVLETTITNLEKDLERVIKEIPEGKATNEGLGGLMNTIAELQAQKHKYEINLPNLELQQSCAQKEYEIIKATVNKTVKVPEILEQLTEKSKTILESENEEEKKNFLDKFSEMNSYFNFFILYYRKSSHKEVISYTNAVKNTLQKLSATVGKVASQLVNKQALEKQYNDVTGKEANVNEIQNDLAQIRDKKALIHQYVMILEAKVNKKTAKKTKNGEDPLAGFSQEDRSTIEAFKKKVSKMKGDSASLYLESYKMVFDNCKKLEGITEEKVTEAEKQLAQEQINIGVIQMCKTLPDEVENLLNNKETILQSTTLEEKYLYIEKILRMYDFQSFKMKDKNNPTYDERMIAYIGDYLESKKPELSKVAEKLSAQIFEANNTQLKTIKYDGKKIQKNLNNKKDIKGMANTIVKLRTYNTGIKVHNDIKGYYDKANAIVRHETDFTEQQNLELGLAVANIRNKYKLEYYEKEKKLEEILPKNITGVHRKRLIQYITYLSETQYLISECDALSHFLNTNDAACLRLSEKMNENDRLAVIVDKVSNDVEAALALSKILGWGTRKYDNEISKYLDAMNIAAIDKAFA